MGWGSGGAKPISRKDDREDSSPRCQDFPSCPRLEHLGRQAGEGSWTDGEPGVPPRPAPRGEVPGQQVCGWSCRVLARGDQGDTSQIW